MRRASEASFTFRDLALSPIKCRGKRTARRLKIPQKWELHRRRIDQTDVEQRSPIRKSKVHSLHLQGKIHFETTIEMRMLIRSGLIVVDMAEPTFRQCMNANALNNTV